MHIASFINRPEIVISICFFIGGFIKISTCMLGFCKGISELLSCKDYRIIVTPIGIIMIILAATTYENMKEMSEWAFNIWPYYAFLFQAILPTVTLIFLEVKIKLKNHTT